MRGGHIRQRKYKWYSSALGNAFTVPSEWKHNHSRRHYHQPPESAFSLRLARTVMFVVPNKSLIIMQRAVCSCQVNLFKVAVLFTCIVMSCQERICLSTHYHAIVNLNSKYSRPMLFRDRQIRIGKCPLHPKYGAQIKVHLNLHAVTNILLSDR